MSTAILNGARDQCALGIVGGRRWMISEMDNFGDGWRWIEEMGDFRR